MPIVTKTLYSESGKLRSTGANMAMAMASAINSECKNTSESSHYVRMDSIGYIGWFVSLESHTDESDADNNYLKLVVGTVNEDGTPNFGDQNNIVETISGAELTNTISGCPETCVMIHDDSYDTVLFDIHPGANIHGADIDDGRRSRVSFCLFFARDVKNNVLCGCGIGHTLQIRNKDSKMDFRNDVGSTVPQKQNNGSPFAFALTKMVNYLDPDLPEMKSAYVSVIRPTDKFERCIYVETLYAKGKKWGRVGLADSWNQPPTYDYPGWCSYFPIEPFVNY